jgi:hypothetical protein
VPPRPVREPGPWAEFPDVVGALAPSTHADEDGAAATPLPAYAAVAVQAPTSTVPATNTPAAMTRAALFPSFAFPHSAGRGLCAFRTIPERPFAKREYG